MVPNFSLNLGALNALAPNSGGMFSSIAPVVASTHSVAPVATPVAPVASTAPVASPMASTGLLGATNIFGDRTYEAPLATPEKTRVGYMEMKKLSETPGFITTNRPEQIGDVYLPFRPSGEGEQVTNDIKTWYNYYSDNPDLRKFLSADEQTELTWLDYRNKKFDQDTFTKKINDIRAQFNLPKKVGFKDFEAHFSYGTKRKKYSDNPYADLQQYGPSIGGYWNPENDPSEFQQAMANPIVNAALTTAGAVVGNMLLPGLGGQALGSALAGGTASKLSGADWEDALKAAAVAGGSAYLGGKLAPTTAASVGEFNIPGVDIFAAPVSEFNKELLGGVIESSLLSPTTASAIANPALSIAAPSFFQTALGQGLGKAGVTLASGGDLKDALTAGVFGYSGAPGGLLSGTLGDTFGLDLGTSTLAKGVEGLNLADTLKFGINLPKDQWSAVGGVLGDMNLGTVGESGVLGSLPPSLENIVENVKVSDLLSNIGGPNLSSLFNIASDINVPSAPKWLKDVYENVEGAVQDAYGAVSNVVSGLVPDSLQSAYENTEGFIQDLLKPVSNSLDNLPKKDILAGLSGSGMLARPQQAAQVYSSPEYRPFMAQVSYDPRLPQLTPIAYSDPLSVLLAEFYKT